MRFPVDKATETKAADTVSLCGCGEDGEGKGGCTSDCYDVLFFL